MLNRNADREGVRRGAPANHARWWMLGMFAMAVFIGGVGAPRQAAASDAELVAEAHRQLVAVFDALATGDPAKVEPFLAPEFQVLRSDGGGYSRDEYLARSIPKISGVPVFKDLIVTRNEDIVVVRLILEIDEVINGKQGAARSPQLMVFRVGPDGWQVISAANFSKLR